MLQVDPLFALTARLILAVVFVPALLHKIRTPAAFLATVANYRLLPDSLVPISSYTILVFELAAIVGLVANTVFGSAIAAILLGTYTVAISINLIKGRTDIDCGCSGPAIRQTLGSWLLVRNSILLIAALLSLLPATERSLSLLDGFSTLAAITSFSLIYAAVNQLAATKTRYVR